MAELTSTVGKTAKQIYNTKYRLNNPEKVKATNLKWRTENPEKVRAINRSQNIKHKDKIKVRRKARRALNPDKERNIRYVQKYGITLKDYNDMLTQQNKLCLICKKDLKLYVDHDHTTGVVRGLLCHKCNTGLGMLQDNINNLLNAINYIKESNDRNRT